METLGGRYRLLELLGEGGMARVYKGQDTLLERTVAIKVLREQFAADPQVLALFQGEARAAARLSHPHIVAVYDVGEERGRPYIVMEYVEGPSLKEVLDREGPLSVSRVVEIARQVCAGLQYAHERGIVHRDIKPHNILLPPHGLAKIADFGIARALGAASVTQPGTVFGSPYYLSPEQARGEECTPASDIYSLGAVLYEAATGRPPFQGDSPVATALKHVNESPLPPQQANPRVPPGLAAIIMRALAKDPRARFATAGDMGQALASYQEMARQETAPLQRPAPASSVIVPPIEPPPVRRDLPAWPEGRGFRWSVLFVTLAAAVLFLGLILLSPTLVRRYILPAMSGLPPATPSPAPTPTLTPTPLPMVLVPGVTNMTAEDARRVIEGQGLAYQEAEPSYSQEVPQGRVISQSPPPGTSLPWGEVVTVVVSRGPELVEVPEVTSLAAEVAEARLAEQGLQALKREAWNDKVAEGQVYGQEPAPGSQVPKGSVVVLLVSKGGERVIVPNVIGMPEERAQRAIAEAGLRNFPWVNYQGHDVLPESVLSKVCVGCVLSTDPEPGKLVDPGTEVKMAVRKD
jgi:serine/threonine-protein kinase